MAVQLETSDYFRDFDWGNLKAFYYVAKVGNISNAAHFLNLAQSSMSRQITGLEKHLGYPLFTRNRAGVILTRKGEELLSVVESTFIGLKGFTHANHARTDATKKRKIRIATTEAVAAYIISDVIHDYNNDHPHLIFEIIGDDHIVDVILNDVDIAIRPFDNRLTDVIQEALFTLEKKLYASEGYIEKYGEPKSVDDLKNHRLIAIGSNPEYYPYADVYWILKLGMPEGKLIEPTFLSNSLECGIRAAKRGVGIISNYDDMSIVREANLKNILPDITAKKTIWYFTFADYLKGDSDINNIKTYLQKILLIKDS